MPAGSQALNTYRAYTQASRHRERSWLVTSDGAERREIVGCLAIRVLSAKRMSERIWRATSRGHRRRPARSTWAQARDLRRGAVQSLQAGLQPAEQRQAEGKDAFTLRETLQRRGDAERVAEMTGQIDAAVREQRRLHQRLSQAVHVICETVRETVKGAAPLLRQAAEALRERQVLRAVQAQLLNHRMGEWRKMQKQNNASDPEQAAQKRFSQGIRAMPKADLQRPAIERGREQEAKQERAMRQRSG